MPRTPLRMPKMSMTMEEGELSVWRVAVGDTVDEGQVVCEVLTDKVDMEVEAPARGTVVELAVDEGASVAVGEPIAWIETASASLMEDLFDAPPAAAEPSPAPPAIEDEPHTGVQVFLDHREGGGLVPAIPRARRLAAESGVELAAVNGSGPGGAVLVSDLETHLRSRAPAAAAAPSAAARAATPWPVSAPAPVPSPAPPAWPVAGDDPWAARALALAPRPEPGSAAAAVLRHEVVLGTTPAPPEEHLLAAIVRAVAAALAASGPPHVRERPRVAVAVPTPAGAVPVTVTAAHAHEPAALAALLAQGLAQARDGHLDVRFLAPPDAVVTWFPDLDEAAVPPAAPALLALGVGRAAPRAVAAGEGIAVRTTVRLSATGAPGTDAGTLAAVLARAAAGLAS